MMIFSTACEKSCQLTGRIFEISDRERVLWESCQVSLPVIAPEERLRRLSAFRSGTALQNRVCDATGQEIVSSFGSHAPFPVFGVDYWYSNSWDPLAYGQSFHFKRLFMEQFLELWRKVPRPALWNHGCSSSEQIQDDEECDHCVTVFGSEKSEDCRYSVGLNECRRCLDCYELSDCEDCYECVWCVGCTRLRYSDTCFGCHDSWLLSNCRDCRHCIGCTNLTGADYYIFNQRYTEEEYRKMVAGFGLEARPLLELARNRFREIHEREPIPHIYADHPEANSGNYLSNTHLCVDSFECRDSTDVINCLGVRRSRTVIDGVDLANIESSAQVISCTNCAHLLNCVACRNSERLVSCSHCEECSDLFACIGLRGRRFCILNQQFSEEEYRGLRERIDHHLRSRAVWGSFFPPGFSGYPYNRSFAGDLMPVTKVPAKMMGFPWDETEDRMKVPERSEAASGSESFAEVPHRATDLDGTPLETAKFLCSITGTPFSISRWEIDFALRLGLPPPEHCFAHRHVQRLALMTPRQMVLRESIPDRTLVRTSVPARWKQPLFRVSELRR